MTRDKCYLYKGKRSKCVPYLCIYNDFYMWGQDIKQIITSLDDKFYIPISSYGKYISSVTHEDNMEFIGEFTLDELKLCQL